MRVFGLNITRTKAAVDLAPVYDRGTWTIINEFKPGAFQKDERINFESAASYSAFYACVTLIANDIGKLRQKLTEEAGGVWEETSVPAFSPVLRKPNRYQNHIQFKEWWVMSKLLHGNTYVLKERDGRGVVVAEYILDPSRVTPLVSEDGSVYYQLMLDYLNTIGEASITVPASEIIHDRMNCLFHPLVGISPIFACATAVIQGKRIQGDSARFFKNGAQPSGVLTAPGAISDVTAGRLKEKWEDNFTGENAGKVAVLGDGLKFEAMRMTSVDAQLIEQLRWSGESVCSCFHVPAYKVGIGTAPAYNNIEALQQEYYSTCLQTLIENYELCQDEGLGIPPNYCVELDLDGLLRMDTATLIKSLTEAIGGGLMAPNEGRKKVGLKPLPGGDTVYLQQQEFSLAALAKRDALPNPFVLDKPTTNPTPSAEGPPPVAEPEKGLPDPAKLEKAMALALEFAAPLSLPEAA